MAGTYADQATLATTNDFINKCRVAMLARAHEILVKPEAEKLAVLQQAINIIRSAGGEAGSMAWQIATGNPTIAAGAPEIPSDSDTQFAVNEQMVLNIS